VPLGGGGIKQGGGGKVIITRSQEGGGGKEKPTNGRLEPPNRKRKSMGKAKGAPLEKYGKEGKK